MSKKLTFYFLSIVIVGILLYISIYFSKIKNGSYLKSDVDKEQILTHPNPDCKESIFLIITVYSQSHRGEQRNAIRHTWGSYSNNQFPIKIYFLVNRSHKYVDQKKVYYESNIYNDILQVNFYDTNEDVHNKLVTFLKLIMSECGYKIKYIMRTQDTTFVNVPALIEVLSKVNDKKLLTFPKGFQFGQLTFPDYLSNMGYVMSVDFFKEVTNSQIPYRGEVYVTERCHRRDEFVPKLKICQLLKVITDCNFSSAEMRITYTNVQKSIADQSCFPAIEANVNGWNENISRDVNIYINLNRSTALMKPDCFCKSKQLVLIVVCSSPSNFEKRIGIRESWGLYKNVSNSIISTYFLLGVPRNKTTQKLLQIENNMYKDIIQEDFEDTYNNLTIKSVRLLKLIKEECRHTVKFVMKVDDDTFVNIPSLITTLQKVQGPILFGKLISQSKPIRNIYDKWYVPNYMYSQDVYPSYLSGSAYVMSTDVAEKLFETALRIPLIHLEDVYLTGICAKVANVKLTMNPNFHTLPIKFNPCKFKNLITCHYISPVEMRFLYYRVKHESLNVNCIEGIKFPWKLHVNTVNNTRNA